MLTVCDGGWVPGRPAHPRKVLREGDGDTISHGICDDCLAGVRALLGDEEIDGDAEIDETDSDSSEPCDCDNPRFCARCGGVDPMDLAKEEEVYDEFPTRVRGDGP